MSLLEEGPQEPQQETLQQTAARIIQKAWRMYVYRGNFKNLKEVISRCNQQDPQTILRTVNPREAELLDAAAGVVIRFRLGGITFPPNIYYKIFTHRPITDVCASSPRDYTQLDLRKPGARQTNSGGPLMQDRSGWYQRMENNSWRLFCCKVVPMVEPLEIGAHKKMDYHYSRLQRQRDVDKWRKMRKIEWMKQMYNQGRLQTQPAQRCMATLEGSSAQEVTDTTEEKEDDEIREWELDELLDWSNTLSFEEYMQEWRYLACSLSSEQRCPFTSTQFRST